MYANAKRCAHALQIESFTLGCCRTSAAQVARQARGSQCILGESSSTGTGMRTVSSDGMGGDAKLVDADTAVSRALPLLTKLVVFVAAKYRSGRASSLLMAWGGTQNWWIRHCPVAFLAKYRSDRAICKLPLLNCIAAAISGQSTQHTYGP